MKYSVIQFVYILIYTYFLIKGTNQSTVPVASPSQQTPGASFSPTTASSAHITFTSTKTIARKSTVHTSVFDGSSSQTRKSSSIEKDSLDIESTSTPNINGKYDRSHLPSCFYL